MLDQSMRTAILTLADKRLSLRKIAQTLGISRDTVRRILASKTAQPPPLSRSEKAETHLPLIVQLLQECKGNLVRVHEKLQEHGVDVSYPALTSFCRRRGISTPPEPPAGHYDFKPGEEMQHDTSPHLIEVGGKKRKAQVASLVLCHSRMLYFQYYPVFRRFECKLFLSQAAQYFGGVCRRCMIDNSHVIVLKGTGAAMVPVPEMEAFGDQFGFHFRAHEKGDANRSARVERPFHYIENNFEAGRTGENWQDWNRQAKEWSDKVNGSFKRTLRASPRDLFLAEQPHLVPLPEWLPEVYELQQRVVDLEGYVWVEGNRYSVPLVPGKGVEVRKSRDRIDAYDGPRRVATHPREEESLGRRITDPAHRPPRGERQKARLGEEEEIGRVAPGLAEYVAGLKKGCHGPAPLALRRLLGMIREYPREALEAAVREAGQYGLYDLERVERMVLKRLRDHFFLGPDERIRESEQT